MSHGIGQDVEKRAGESDRGANRFGKPKGSIEISRIEGGTVPSDDAERDQNVIETTALITVPKLDRRPHLNFNFCRQVWAAVEFWN